MTSTRGLTLRRSRVSSNNEVQRSAGVYRPDRWDSSSTLRQEAPATCAEAPLKAGGHSGQLCNVVQCRLIDAPSRSVRLLGPELFDELLMSAVATDDMLHLQTARLLFDAFWMNRGVHHATGH